jgi:predicted ATPase
MAGALDAAMDSIQEAQEALSRSQLLNPDLLRIRGEIWLRRGSDEAAEADFREAIARTQMMSAKMLELRATTSLARLLAKQGKRGEARAMLSNIYNWFTEGFDTADLKDAKALLAELGG